MVTFSKPGWFIAAGIISAVIFSMATSDPVEETAKVEQQTKVDSEEAEKKAKVEAEKKAKAEAEKKAKEEEEKKLAEEKAKKEAEEKAKAKAEEETKKQELVTQFNLEAVTIARAVDGDTVELEDGRKIRLIGVNTPESTNRQEEYGKEASNYTSEQLEGKQVWIQKDVSDTDRYGRYLRIIWMAIPEDDMNEEEIRSKMFNANLVLNGYAEPSTYQPDVKYSEHFVKFAREAREKDKGLWAYGENGTTKGDLDPKEEKATATTTKPPSSSSSSSSKPPANTTTPPSTAPKQESFKNCTELRKVYPNGVASDHPAYASKHDRDKDGWACER